MRTQPPPNATALHEELLVLRVHLHARLPDLTLSDAQLAAAWRAGQDTPPTHWTPVTIDTPDPNVVTLVRGLLRLQTLVVV